MNDKKSKTCGNCYDFDKEKSICLIRFCTYNKNRTPMKRKATDTGCKVFLYK